MYIKFDMLGIELIFVAKHIKLLSKNRNLSYFNEFLNVVVSIRHITIFMFL